MWWYFISKLGKGPEVTDYCPRAKFLFCRNRYGSYHIIWILVKAAQHNSQTAHKLIPRPRFIQGCLETRSYKSLGCKKRMDSGRCWTQATMTSLLPQPWTMMMIRIRIRIRMKSMDIIMFWGGRWGQHWCRIYIVDGCCGEIVKTMTPLRPQPWTILHLCNIPCHSMTLVEGHQVLIRWETSRDRSNLLVSKR